MLSPFVEPQFQPWLLPLHDNLSQTEMINLVIHLNRTPLLYVFICVWA